MKPKTILQKKIVGLNGELPAITEKQIQWGIKKLFSPSVVLSRKTLHCLECGASWRDESVTKKCVCPDCGNILKLKGHNAVQFKEMEYFAVLTTKENYQVVRIICTYKYMKKNEKPSYFTSEVMQHWIDEKGITTCMARNVQGMSPAYDQWIFSSDLEVRPADYVLSPRFGINPYKIYPERKILPILKRNGFKGNFHEFAPQTLFVLILTDSYAETLLKTNQINLLKFYPRNHYRDENPKIYWNSIKICTKNNYIIKDSSIWIDYIKLLIYFKRDLLNPKYICPANLNRAHDKLVEKKRKIQLRQKYEEMREKIEKDQVQYIDQKQAFLGMEFKDKNIAIKVIDSVHEFLEEGDTHKHCVFTNEYFKKSDSLVLSASVDDNKVETIEISLSEMKIMQSQGRGNKASKYNKEIVKLVNKNLPLINSIKNQQMLQKAV